MANILRFVILGDDRGGPAFATFTKQVEKANAAVDRNNAALKRQGKAAQDARGGLAGLAGEVTGFGAAAGVASSKTSMFGKVLAGIQLSTGVLEPAMAGAVVAAGGLAAAFTAAAGGAIAYNVALKPLLSQTQDTMKAQETLDKARAAAQANYTAAIKAGASPQAAAAARTRAMTAAQEKYNAAVAGTPGPVRAFAAQVSAAKDTWTSWADSLAKPVLAPLSTGLKMVSPALRALTPLVRVAAGAFGTLMEELGRKVQAGGLTSVVQTILPHVRTTILDLGHATGNVVAGIWGILKAFLPVSGQLTGGVVKLTARFKEWANSLPSHTGFQSLMTMFREQTPQALAILKNLGTTLVNIGKAMTGLSTFSNSKLLLSALLPLSVILERLSQNRALVNIALYLYAIHAAAVKLNPAFQALFGVNGEGGILRGAWKAVGWIGQLTKAMLGLDAAMNANVVGLVVVAIAALAAAFYLAWQRSAGFRQVIKDIGAGFLQAGIIIVRANKVIIDAVLGLFGAIIHGAASAFSWVPGLGGKLKGAAAAFDGFRRGVDNAMGGAIGTMQKWQKELLSTGPTAQQVAAKVVGAFNSQGQAAGKARLLLDLYSGSITKNAVNSAQARSYRVALINDLVQAGVKSTTARADVDRYTTAVRINGRDSDAARAARVRLNNDIIAAYRNAQQGRRDISSLALAIRDHGVRSDATRQARLRLIQDLINSGVDAHSARDWVNRMQGAINNMKGKTVPVGVNAVGTGGFKLYAQGVINKNFQLMKLKAAGGIIDEGTGPTADDVPIMASRGEYVIRASSVAKYGQPMMHAINAGRFAYGGVVDMVPTVSSAEAQVTAWAEEKVVRDVYAAALKAIQAMGGGSGAAVLAYARRFLGHPYVWGAAGPNAFDCSGLVSYVYDHFGLFHGRTNAAGFKHWAKPSGPVPGGLAFYGSSPVHHVGFVTEDHRLLSALGRKYGVTISALNMGDNSGYGIPPRGFGVAGGVPGGGVTPKGTIQELAYSMLNQYGWSGQWGSLNALEMREAGWNMRARNPSSGAYGLAQGITGPSWYYGYGGNPNTALGQLTAMYNYIASRYGSPARAWAHEVAYNWYDRGGWLPAGWSMAYNGTGRPEPVGAAAAGGNTYQITVNVPPTASKADTGRAVVECIRAYEQGSGTRWRR